jgi:predicted RNA binding protein YcfA (HicA-like mRNA interferase family)
VKLRDLERHLRAHGCSHIGEGAKHSKWRGPTGRASTVPRHSEIAPGTVRAICEQLGVPRP